MSAVDTLTSTQPPDLRVGPLRRLRYDERELYKMMLEDGIDDTCILEAGFAGNGLDWKPDRLRKAVDDLVAAGLVYWIPGEEGREFARVLFHMLPVIVDEVSDDGLLRMHVCANECHEYVTEPSVLVPVTAEPNDICARESVSVDGPWLRQAIRNGLAVNDGDVERLRGTGWKAKE